MNVLVIDTETANSVEQPLPYDVGYAIVDTSTGEILVKRSFVVAEIFFDKELMKEAYFAEKVPQYWKDIKSKKRVVKSICFIRRTIKKDMADFKVKKVGAYNMGFDNRATKNDIRFISGSMIKWFFPYGTEFFCIWNMACTSILKTESYIRFAIENNFVSECGNIQTSAEVAYRYITKNVNFVEDHTGLEDVLIEIAIMMEVLKSKMEYKDRIYSACWREVQRKRKQMELDEVFNAQALKISSSRPGRRHFAQKQILYFVQYYILIFQLNVL